MYVFVCRFLFVLFLCVFSVPFMILLQSSIPLGNYSAEPKETLGKYAIQCCSSKLMRENNSTKLVEKLSTVVSKFVNVVQVFNFLVKT